MRVLMAGLVLALGLGITAQYYQPHHYQVLIQRPVDDAVETRMRTFSPDSDAFASAIAKRVEPPAAVETAAVPERATVRPEALTWDPIVTAAPGTLGRITSVQPGDIEARAELVRNLQRELNRVGCYDGMIDGQWGQMSRQAMAQFKKRVDSTLSSGEPDYILLALVKGQTRRVCGVCPAGETMMPGGICAPSPGEASVEAPPSDVSSEPLTALSDQPSLETMPLAPPLPNRSIENLFTHPLGTE